MFKFSIFVRFFLENTIEPMKKIDEKILIYTDGASRGNPGPGGFGTLLLYKGHRKELSQGYRFTTNNRMELLAVIVGLETLKHENLEVVVTSDSRYVVDAVEKGWVFKWEKINFKKKKNPDLWKRFLVIYRKHRVSFKWIKGHSQHPLNERCDELAVDAALYSELLIDAVFEKVHKEEQKKLF